MDAREHRWNAHVTEHGRAWADQQRSTSDLLESQRAELAQRESALRRAEEALEGAQRKARDEAHDREADARRQNEDLQRARSVFRDETARFMEQYSALKHRLGGKSHGQSHPNSQLW